MLKPILVVFVVALCQSCADYSHLPPCRSADQSDSVGVITSISVSAAGGLGGSVYTVELDSSRVLVIRRFYRGCDFGTGMKLWRTRGRDTDGFTGCCVEGLYWASY